MLISLWNCLRGYVIIEVRGFSVERFVNLATHKGVYIWDAEYTENGISMKVSVKAFKLLKECSRKTKCHIKIVGRKGYPFVLNKYRKRKFLAFGFVFFITLIYFLSLFIWRIDVIGTKRMDSDEILAFCKEEGFSPGDMKFKTDVNDLEKKMLQEFQDISWVNISVNGTKATIDIIETIPKQAIVDRETPCSIVAAKDSVIESIITSAGAPMVKQQDVVQKGDVLVSGELIIKEDENGAIKEYVHADADVLGKLYYEINFEVPFQYVEKDFTGNINKDYDIIFFGRRIGFPRNDVPFENYKKSISRKQLTLGENYPLPIILAITTFEEFVPIQRTRILEQAVELSERMVNSRVIRELDVQTDIIDKKVDYIENNSEGIIVNALITTIENIGVEEIIILLENESLASKKNEL